MKYELNCIKCKTRYSTDDPDPYLCETCKIEKNKIAEQIDKKLAGKISRSAKSQLKQLEELSQNRGTFKT